MKAYTIRLYPTKTQEESMVKHINACRYVWNWMIEQQEKFYKESKMHLSAFDMIKLLTPLKNDGEHDWLYEVSNATLQVVCRDLRKCYENVINHRSNLPKFKTKKHSKPIFPVCSTTSWFEKDVIHIQKIGKIKYKASCKINIGRCGNKIFNPRIQNICGKWLLSFVRDDENQAVSLSDKSMGIDLGLKNFMTIAYGDDMIVFPNINKSKKIKDTEKRIIFLRRSISRKYRANNFKKTKNIKKIEARVKKMIRKISNIRKNYIHQCTHKLISLLPSKIVMETLNIKGMIKNRHLSKAISDSCFYEAIRQLKYKCSWKGIRFIQADRFFPSSKLCYNCGCIHKELKLSDRVYVCPECGFTIDRDYQAALNLQRYED